MLGAVKRSPGETLQLAALADSELEARTYHAGQSYAALGQDMAA